MKVYIKYLDPLNESHRRMFQSITDYKNWKKEYIALVEAGKLDALIFKSISKTEFDELPS